MSARSRRHALLLAVVLAVGAPARASAEAVEYERAESGRITLVARDVSVNELFEMLARKERVSIVLGESVEGDVSVSLFDVSLHRAIRSIAEAAGFAAERRGRAYLILAHDDVGETSGASTRVVSFKVHYSDPEKTSEMLEKHLSRHGAVTAMPERRMVVVEDLPEFVDRVRSVLEQIDVRPRQILLETRILEVTLDDADVFGIDWTNLFSADDGDGSFGVRGQTTPVTPGLFFEVVTSDIEAALNALNEKGRVRTLSSPSILALEHHEAEVVIGDRLGYRVTTTINEVTTESVEFLESGVILRFTAAVDRDGRIMLEVHPEVSTGVIDAGLPSQTTAEVTTNLLVDPAQHVLIGGLIKDRLSENRSGVPFLGDLPWVGWLFSRRDRVLVSTETVVLVQAHIVDQDTDPHSRIARERADAEREELHEQRDVARERLERGRFPPDHAPAAPAADPDPVP